MKRPRKLQINLFISYIAYAEMVLLILHKYKET